MNVEPTQITLENGTVLTVASEAEAYADGRQSGHSWDGTWIPGGPFVHKKGYSYGAWADYCRLSAQHNRAYMSGWFDGVIVGSATNPNPWVTQSMEKLTEAADRNLKWSVK